MEVNITENGERAYLTTQIFDKYKPSKIDNLNFRFDIFKIFIKDPIFLLVRIINLKKSNI